MRPQPILPILMLLLALPALSSAADDPFTVTDLDLGTDRVRAIRIADLGGDGVQDIVAFTEGPGGPGVHVIPVRADPGAGPVTLRPAETGLGAAYYFFLARLREGRGHEIVAVDKLMGVVALALAEEESEQGRNWALLPPRPVAPAPRVPFWPEPGRIHVLDAAADLDGDGIDELILPAEKGFEVITPGEEGTGGPKNVRPIDVHLDHELSSPSHQFFALTWILPRITVDDWDGDGLLDLIAGHEGHILVFLQQKDGEFKPESRRLRLLDIEPDPARRNTFTLGDVNGDRRTDLLLTRSPTSIGLLEKFKSAQYLLLNPQIVSTENSGNLNRPASVINTSGISVNPALIDFDGDGDRDLLITSLDLDMKARMLKQVTAAYLLFLFDEEKGAFEKKNAHFRIARPFPVAQLERESTAPVCFFTGDYDGDGKRDLLDIADDGHLTMLRGTDDPGFLAADAYGFSEEIFKTELSLDNDVRILDLNGDGASDVVGHDGSRIHVLRSRK